MLNFDTCPLHPRQHGEIFAYVEYGLPPGEFLQAVLTNDLRGATRFADPYNLTRLPSLVTWLWNEVPAPCWGSPQKYHQWRRMKAGAITIPPGLTPEQLGKEK